MADIQPVQAFAAGGFGAGGETSQFALTAPNAFVASVITAVAGDDPSLQVFLDVLQEGNWLQAAELTAQSAAGVESAVASVPPDASPAFRLRWTVSAGAEFTGYAFAVGAG